MPLASIAPSLARCVPRPDMLALHDVWHLAASLTAVMLRKTKRQYLLTLQVSRYCLLALQGGVALAGTG